MPISHPRLYEHTRHMSPTEVPDCVWPSDNEMEVPMLRPDLQANAVDLPVTQWGTIRRRSDMHGTWSFYVDDYRFTALWRDPTPVINSGCLNVVEPNFSCSDQTPFPVVLNNIYRKRWLSRFWQEFGGVRVFVDLNVSPRWGELNLLGVPQGWRSYATRGYSSRIKDMDREYQRALAHCGDNSMLMMVYGGGKAVREFCQQRGLIWVAEQQTLGTRGVDL